MLNLVQSMHFFVRQILRFTAQSLPKAMFVRWMNVKFVIMIHIIAWTNLSQIKTNPLTKLRHIFGVTRANITRVCYQSNYICPFSLSFLGTYIHKKKTTRMIYEHKWQHAHFSSALLSYVFLLRSFARWRERSIQINSFPIEMCTLAWTLYFIPLIHTQCWTHCHSNNSIK